jgi:hypothetical protein
MKAPGSSIDWRMNALSLPLRTLSRSGPVVPLVPASASVWQPPQPALVVKICLASGFAVCPPPPAVAPPGWLCFLSHASKSARLTTCAVWRMTEWPRPHSSAQTTGYSPMRFGVARMLVLIPGTASIFMRNAGTQKSWITSRDWTVNFTCWFCGT